MINRNRSPFRYVGSLARDVARGPGVLYIVSAALMLFILWRVNESGPIHQIDAKSFQAQLFNTVLLVATLIATGGIVSGDIRHGYYRVWFSKPIAPWLFYLQRWLLGTVQLLLMPFVLALGLVPILGGGSGITVALLGNIALAYLLYGATVILLSNLTRHDWLIVFILVFVQTTLQKAIDMGVPVSASMKSVARILPPYHLLNSTGQVPTGAALTHVIVYGGGMLVLALIVVWVRPLGSGGRA